MLKAKLIYIKDKQAFSKDGGVLRLLGKPIDIAKKLKDDGFELLHIIDTDAQKGSRTNFDIYDKMTYFLNIELECGEGEELIEKLLKINARAVVTLPTKKLDLEKFAEKKRLIVGKISSDFEGNVDGVYDLIIENATLESVKKFAKLKKRILVHEKDCNKEIEKLVFGVIS